MIILFEIDRKKLLNSNMNLHHRAKALRIKKLREYAFEKGSQYNNRFNHFDITVKVYAPTKRRLDSHNLQPTVKALIDGLTDSELWEDDDFKHLRYVTFCYGGLVKECFEDEFDKNSFVLEFNITEV